MRKIILSGGIDEESFKDFCEQMGELEEGPAGVIDIDLCSGGGDAYTALGFCARIRTSSCATRVVVYGSCQSAAVLILAAGTKRYMTKESWVMVHEDQAVPEGATSLIEVESKQLRAMEDQWSKLLAEYTKTSAKKWAKLHKETTYLTPEQCLKLGLIDGVV
jgi:ATP-dependent protease ClpP protease subunit